MSCISSLDQVLHSSLAPLQASALKLPFPLISRRTCACSASWCWAMRSFIYLLFREWMVFLVKRIGFVYRRVNANHRHHYYHHGRSWKAMNYDNDNSQVSNWWQYAAPVKPDADAACAGANLRSSSNSSLHEQASSLQSRVSKATQVSIRGMEA